MALVVKKKKKNHPANAGDRCRFDTWVGKIPLEKRMVTHSSILAWRIPWTEEPGATIHGVTQLDTTEAT